MAAFAFKSIAMTISIFIALVIVYVSIAAYSAYVIQTGKHGQPKTSEIPAPPKVKPVKSKMNIRLTMRTLIRWEQLRGKSFSLMDYSDEEDMAALLYCSVMCCNKGTLYTLDEFKHTMQNDKLVRQMAMALSRESTVMAQFRQEQESMEEQTSAETGCIKDIVSTLITGGLDIGFVMDEMQLCDLPLFITAYENKRNEQMESDRLWTYLTILPHVDGKKLPSARELYPFPWEQKELEEDAARAIQEDADKLEAFFEQGKNLIRQNYGG